MRSSTSIVLETERLLVRSPRLEDADALAGLYADPEATAFIGGVRDDLDTRAAVRRWLERWEADGLGQLVVERRGDGAVLGRAGLVVWDTRVWRITSRAEAGEHAQPELGWALARSAWGRGYATEAARAVLLWAQEQLDVPRLVSVIAPENTRSIRVAEKLGAVPREMVRLDDGYVGDAVVWEHRP
jgi:RimJ/RimL family protein N-acetyltransferase